MGEEQAAIQQTEAILTEPASDPGGYSLDLPANHATIPPDSTLHPIQNIPDDAAGGYEGMYSMEQMMFPGQGEPIMYGGKIMKGPGPSGWIFSCARRSFLYL